VPLRDIIANELKSTGPLPINEQEIDDFDYSQQIYQQQTLASKTLQQSKSDELNLPSKAYNTKTVQLMNKMQSEFEEKQKRKKIRRNEQLKSQQQLESSTSSPKLSKSTSELKSASTTPKSERKFLTSIINTLFSTGSYEASDQTTSSQNNNSSLQKNDTKRLSLRKLKAKNKAKKTGEQNDAEFNQSDSEINNNTGLASQKFIKSSSNHSLNIALNYESNNEDDIVDYVSSQPSTSPMTTSMPIAAARFGKIKNEDEKPQINENNKENLMKQLKAELDEEIKDRRMIELKQNLINGLNNDLSESASGGCGGSSTSSHVSSGLPSF
jgi:hypothetical protein